MNGVAQAAGGAGETGSRRLRINRVHHPVTALGPGRRLGLWVQGCPLGCLGCMSQDTWAPLDGFEVPVAELAGMWRRAVADGADGLTVSGGEPLAQPEDLAALLAEVRRIADEMAAPGGPAAGRELDILLYTGYEEHELDGAQQAVLGHADVVVTGRYVASAPTRLLWRGSANQVMRIRTDLGRRRYGPCLDLAPERAPLQMSIEGDSVRVIGVPHRGDLARLERGLRSGGIATGDPTWRPLRA